MQRQRQFMASRITLDELTTVHPSCWERIEGIVDVMANYWTIIYFALDTGMEIKGQFLACTHQAHHGRLATQPYFQIY